MNQGAKANDFCILSRGKTKFLYLERFARQLDIPISVQKDESVVDNPLWDCIYDILCCYSKKNYKFHLYSLLHSFLFGCEDNDLYKIFTLANEEFYQQELVKMVEDKDLIVVFLLAFALFRVFNESSECCRVGGKRFNRC